MTEEMDSRDLESAYKLVLSMAWKFYRKCPHPDISYEDLVSYGWEGVDRAWEKYNAGRGAFITYCWYWIYYYIQRGINNWGYVKLDSVMYPETSFCSSDEIAGEIEDDSFSVGVMVPVLVERVMSLRPRLRDVLILRYFLDMNGPEAGAVLGITRDAVNKLEKKAITAMRELYADGSDGTD